MLHYGERVESDGGNTSYAAEAFQSEFNLRLESLSLRLVVSEVGHSITIIKMKVVLYTINISGHMLRSQHFSSLIVQNSSTNIDWYTHYSLRINIYDDMRQLYLTCFSRIKTSIHCS